MKFSRSDFVLMRWNILAICTATVVGILAWYSSSEYADNAQKDRRNTQRQLDEARLRLRTAQEDERNMAMYADEYGALISRKIIGDNHRLDWMEGLEKIRQQNLVADFRYSIAPQKIYTPQPPLDSGNFDVHYSEMKLQLDLLHEDQLLRFFAALHNQLKGLYQLEGCTLTRIAADAGNEAAPATAHLKAECSGGWITLKNRTVPQ